ncbi:CoA transferase, partial [Nocardioides sp.]|uniref:CoA transferase n=1 Tax=Nocardioides sp. TaxID=35761 RepID=UPI0027369848
GAPASAVRRALDEVAERTRRRTGTMPELPGVELLGERAAIAGLQRNGPWSCGGAYRALPTANGWWGLSLPRADDLALVPALVGRSSLGDAWSTVARWARERPTDEVVSRAHMLGLACAAIPLGPGPPQRAPVTTVAGGTRSHRRERPLVVDLTALWAGPLCAHLIGLGGADVIKVETPHRPDGARNGAAAFFDLLHAGHLMLALDLREESDVRALRTLISRADLVLEASRPRALRQAGLNATEIVADGTSWLSITARGRSEDVIGFGDDVAAGAGLVVVDRDGVLPCGDALADPLTGVVAASAAAAVLLEKRAHLVDVSMHHVATAAAASGVPEPHLVERRGDAWWVQCDAGEVPVSDPVARASRGPAGKLGADTRAVLG